LSDNLLVLPDTAQRARIANDLDTNLLVEAGAGAGKTTEMIKRMLALVGSGRAQVEQIAAVTFTRKAAAELRERFQNGLEEAILAARDQRNTFLEQRLDTALRSIDAGFIGTIHAFCARMLREHPIEAGLDPDFSEVVEVEEMIMRRHAWVRACERFAHDDARELRELITVGLKPAQLFTLYDKMCDFTDVQFPAPHHSRPDPTRVRERLELLVDHARAVLPFKRPAGGYDDLQRRLRGLIFKRDVLSWNDESNFFDALVERLRGRLELRIRLEFPEALRRIRAGQVDGMRRSVLRKILTRQRSKLAVRVLPGRVLGACGRDGQRQRDCSGRDTSDQRRCGTN
jgi:ATP-dependent helicase/nuclease subunit A